MNTHPYMPQNSTKKNIWGGFNSAVACEYDQKYLIAVKLWNKD